MVRHAVVTASALAALAAPAASAATTTPAPSVARTTQLSSYGGHLVFSDYDTSIGRYRLTDISGGRLTRLDVPTRSVPFDADVGPDGEGNPIVVYSRCKKDPPMNDLGDVQWSRAAGCDIWVHRFGKGSSKAKNVNSSNSEYLPSVWRGNLAFARRYPSKPAPAKNIPYLYVRGSHSTTRVAGGTVPLCNVQAQSGGYCSPATDVGPLTMDLYGTHLAYEWTFSGATTAGIGPAWEVRVTDISLPHSRLLKSGVTGGAAFDDCDGKPRWPSIHKDRVWFGESSGTSSCKRPQTDVFRYDIHTGEGSQAHFAGAIAGMPGGADPTTFLTVTRLVSFDEEAAPTCEPTAFSCLIESRAPLAFTPVTWRRRTPWALCFSYDPAAQPLKTTC